MDLVDAREWIRCMYVVPGGAAAAAVAVAVKVARKRGREGIAPPLLMLRIT